MATAVVVAACGPLLGLGQSSGWSFAADFRGVGVDFVIRYTSSDAPVFLLRSGEDSGIVHAGAGSPDPSATVAVLDAVTCRVVFLVDPVPGGHNRLDLTSAWLYTVDPYDPADYGDPSTPEGSLPVTDKCASSDPTSTPKPDPTMAAGTWLNGWEMSCEAEGDGANPFSVRGESLDGSTAGCEAHTGEIGQGPTDESAAVSIWNPEGDMNRLGVAWKDTACANLATVSIYPTTAGYRAHVISIGSKCAPALKPYAVIFHLTEPLDARLIQGAVERIAE